MPRRDLTFRVFVSSTFSDLVAERNALQERVFPRLRDYCRSRGARFQAIDLRWGVSQEASLDQQTMNICQQELRRCQELSPRPNFIVLLGDRYGWQPLPPQIEAAEFESLLEHTPEDDRQRLLRWYRRDDNAVPTEYCLLPRTEPFTDEEGWLVEEAALRTILSRALEQVIPAGDPRRRKYEESATHQEIRAGALEVDDADSHVFCYFREIEGLPQGSEAGGSRDLTPVEQLKIELKGGLPKEHVYEDRGPRSSQGPQFDLEALCARVERDLQNIIDAELEAFEEVSPLEQEVRAHEEFGEARRRHFIGRQDVLGTIRNYLAGESRTPLVIHGRSGSGKTALLAKAWADHAGDAVGEVVGRYLGATPAASDIRSVLESLCSQTSEVYGDEAPVPTDYRELAEALPKRFALATPERPLVVFLDAVDQLSPTDNAHTLSWLPRELPEHVKLVVSVLEVAGPVGASYEAARRLLPADCLVELGGLTSSEGEQLLDTWLDDAGRVLAGEQKQDLLTNFSGCPLPLYLKLAFEEARRWKSYDGLPTGSDDIPGLNGDISGILHDLFARLEEPAHHGAELVRRALAYLSAGRDGLVEDELLDVLSADEEVIADFKRRSPQSPDVDLLPPVLWSRLFADLEPYLMTRRSDEAHVLSFYHRQVAEAVEARYLQGGNKLRAHRHLAQYFAGQTRFADQPHQFTDQAGAKQPNRRKVSELPYQQTHAQLWDELELVLTDLQFIEAKCTAGLTLDLIEDYNGALDAHPELEEERSAERTRIAMLQEYGAKLIEYAKARGEGVPLPEPPDTRPVIKRFREVNEQADAAYHPPETQSGRIREFANFVTTQSHIMSRFPQETIPIAYNYAEDGLVIESAVSLTRDLNRPFLARIHRRPAVAKNPLCHQTLVGHTGAVLSVAITSDGRRAVSAGGKDTLKVWDLETGEEESRLKGHTSSVRSVAITPDGRRAVSAGYENTLEVWDLETRRGESTLEGHTRWILSVAITPDGRRAVSASEDKTVRVWDLKTGRVESTLEGYKQREMSVAITPDGRRAVSAGYENTLEVWDLETRRGESTLEGHTDHVHAVAITPNGHRAVSGSWDKTLRMWDLETGRLECTLQGHTDWVMSVAITPDGRRAVSGSKDKTVRVWDLETGQLECTLQGHSDLVGSVAITPDGRRAVSGSGDETLRVWDLDTGRLESTPERHTDRIMSVAFTPDGRRAVSAGGKDKTLRVWDSETGRVESTLGGHTSWVMSVAIAPDGRRAVSGSDELRVWDLETGRLESTLEEPRGHIMYVAITPDGRRAVSSSGIDTLKVWDLETGQLESTTEGHTDSANLVAITPDGRRAVSQSYDGHSVWVWDLETGRLESTLKGHTDYVWSVAITPDGHRAVSVSYDKTLRVWDLETGHLVSTFEGHTDSSVAITPDGRRAISTGSDEKTLRVWDLETGTCEATYCVAASSRAVAVHGPDRIVCGTDDGQLHFLTLRNFD